MLSEPQRKGCIRLRPAFQLADLLSLPAQLQFGSLGQIQFLNHWALHLPIDARLEMYVEAFRCCPGPSNTVRFIASGSAVG